MINVRTEIQKEYENRLDEKIRNAIELRETHCSLMVGQQDLTAILPLLGGYQSAGYIVKEIDRDKWAIVYDIAWNY